MMPDTPQLQVLDPRVANYLRLFRDPAFHGVRRPSERFAFAIEEAFGEGHDIAIRFLGGLLLLTDDELISAAGDVTPGVPSAGQDQDLDLAARLAAAPPGKRAPLIRSAVKRAVLLWAAEGPVIPIRTNLPGGDR